MRRLISVLGAGLVLMAVGACRPSEGGSCTQNATSCDSPASRFACVTGHYVLETCKGEGACKETPKGVTCDSTRGDVGDPCASANLYVCSVDGKSRLRCDDGKLAFVSRCAKDGCTVDDSGGAHCGEPFAKVGDHCKHLPNQTERASGACNEDFKSELACKDGKMALTHQCRGEQGCTPLTSGPWCDRSVGVLGDDCDPDKPEFSVACEAGHETMFTCKAGKLAQSVKCAGEGKCYVRQYGQDGFSHYQAECDQSSANAGDECAKEGRQACSEDKTARLTCQMGKFVVERTCNMKVKHKKDEPDRSGCMIHAPDGTSYGCEN